MDAANIQPGDLVCIKTTGEEAIVLATTGVLGTKLLLGVPRMTRDGIHHYEREVYPFEVESKLDNFKRDLAWHVQRQQLVKDAETAQAVGESAKTIPIKKDPQIN